MKIFMLIKKLRYSGAYKMFMWLADALCKQGHSVTVMTYMSNDVKELNPKINWIKHDKCGSKNIFKRINIIRKEIKKENPDISISFLLDSNVYNIFACYGLRTKSIVCERNDPFKPKYYKLKIFKPLFRYADGAVFQLPKVAEYYNNIKSNTVIIPNPVIVNYDIELKPFSQRPERINVLGRLDIFQKRLDIMLRAFEIFLRTNPLYKIIFYGDGPDKDKLKSLANDLKISDKVVFAGITNKPMSIMANSRLFVMTSDFEGIPNALIEAMSIGLPCISTDCRPGGARLLVKDGYNGFLVPTGDAELIAYKMNLIANNSDLATKIGENAKKVREEYSEEKIISMWESYLSSILK